MTFPSINPTTTAAWKKLQDHFVEEQQHTLQDYFRTDPQRFAHFSIKWEDFLVDISKNNLSKKTLGLLEELANEVKLQQAMEAYFGG